MDITLSREELAALKKVLPIVIHNDTSIKPQEVNLTYLEYAALCSVLDKLN